MHDSYFVKRYRKALRLADKAKTRSERLLHLRNSRHYLGLIGFCARHGSRGDAR